MKNPIFNHIKYDVFQITVAVLCAVLAFVLVWQRGNRIRQTEEMVPVLAAAGNLNPPVILSEKDVRIVWIPRGSVPKNVIGVEKADAVGLTLVHPLSENQILTTNEVLSETDPNLLGLTIPVGRFGFSLPHSWFSGGLPRVVVGDLVTVVASTGTQDNTGIIALNLPVLAVNSNKAEVLDILVAVNEKEAKALTLSRAMDASMQLMAVGSGPLSGVGSALQERQ